MPTEGIAKGLAREEVDLTTEYLTKLNNHIHPIVKAPLRILSEGDQDIYVAIGSEILPEDRAEDGQFSDFPPATKIADALFWNRNVDPGHIHTQHVDT